jgi:hypothetical protein
VPIFLVSPQIHDARNKFTTNIDLYGFWVANLAASWKQRRNDVPLLQVDHARTKFGAQTASLRSCATNYF